MWFSLLKIKLTCKPNNIPLLDFPTILTTKEENNKLSKERVATNKEKQNDFKIGKNRKFNFQFKETDNIKKILSTFIEIGSMFFSFRVGTMSLARFYMPYRWYI